MHELFKKQYSSTGVGRLTLRNQTNCYSKN